MYTLYTSSVHLSTSSRVNTWCISRR